jgi:hypothetical protein
MLSPTAIDANGLSGIVDMTAQQRLVEGAGPDDIDGAGGGLVVSMQPDRPVGFYPLKQSWRRAPGGSHWLGWWNDAPPGPADLMRSEGLPGYMLTLGDGRQWLCPVARMCDDTIALDQNITLGDSGKLERQVCDRYAGIWATTLRVWEVIKAAQQGPTSEGVKVQPLSDDEEWAAAIAALALNYRIGAAEVSVLRLLTTKSIKTVLEALVDVPGILAIGRAMLGDDQKKTPATAG